MPVVRAAFAAAISLACALTAGLVLVSADAAQAAWDKPWTDENRALVIDAYEFNPIDWKELTADKRIAGFINKASDGLPPEWNCNGKSGDDALLCKNRWWKYTVTKELYLTRRAMAKTLGLKWGAYHLARPGNPREQADHFIDFAEPEADDLIAIDIEDNTDEWMSLADAEIFSNQIFIRTGRYPVLYTNGSTAKWISDYKETYPLLSRLPLWYARYREDITGLFPETTWPTYALWQFSSMHNCSKTQCPYRVKGAKSDIDVNVASMDVESLRAAWPFSDLVRPMAEPAAPTLIAELKQKAERAIGSLVGDLSLIGETHEVKAAAPLPTPPTAPVAVAVAEAPAKPATTAKAVKGDATLLAAYGPAEHHSARVDPLQLLTDLARHPEAASARRSPVQTARRTIAPGQPVQTASLGAFGGLESEMKRVASIVPKAGDAVTDLSAMPASALGETEKSRLRLWLRQANDELKASLAAGDEIAAAAPSVRGPRLAAARMVRSPVGPALDQRIAAAFLSTR
jgi:GH25 family lysozyme M1 (1,4-beta-N-acetylmuramidase)